MAGKGSVGTGSSVLVLVFTFMTLASRLASCLHSVLNSAELLTVAAKAREKEPEAGWHLSDGPLKSGHGVPRRRVRNTSEDLRLCVRCDEAEAKPQTLLQGRDAPMFQGRTFQLSVYIAHLRGGKTPQHQRCTCTGAHAHLL